MKSFKNKLVTQHYFSFLNQTNNLIRYAADITQIDHKKRELPPNVLKSLGSPEGVKTMFDYQTRIGFGYNRLYSLVIISNCSDIEHLLKDVGDELGVPTPKDRMIFQKLDLANEQIFKPKGIDFQQFESFYDLKMGFQIRHLYVHNMGYVDGHFIKNTNLAVEENTLYLVSQEIISTQLLAYERFLDFLDEKLSLEP